MSYLDDTAKLQQELTALWALRDADKQTIEALRQRVNELEGESEEYAQLQARCFDQGGNSVFDEVRTLQAELVTLKQAQGEPVAKIECDGETWKRAKLNAAGLKLPNGAKLYTSAPTIPAGWQIVPTKADKNMWHTFIDTYNAYGFESAYRDLLSAAPKPGEPA